MKFLRGFHKIADDKEIEMSKKDFKKEHKRLIGILKSKSHKDDVQEAKRQEKEVKEELK